VIVPSISSSSGVERVALCDYDSCLNDGKCTLVTSG